MCVDYSLAPLQTVTQLFVDLPSCNEKHSAMATPWVQLAFWFIEIHCWPVLSHQVCGESQTDTSQFLSLLSLYLVSSYCQTFFFASTAAKGAVIYPAKPQLTRDTWVGQLMPKPQTLLHFHCFFWLWRIYTPAVSANQIFMYFLLSYFCWNPLLFLKSLWMPSHFPPIFLMYHSYNFWS